MNKTIYISGSITNPDSGQPRDGWQKDFLEAEARLKDMGFDVINPVELAVKAEDEWEKRVMRPLSVDTPPRWFYLHTCLQTIACRQMVGGFVEDITGHSATRLAGLYVLGTPEQIRRSYGTMCEINFALSASLPIYSQYYHGYQMDNQLRQLTDRPTLAEAAREDSSK